MPRKIPKYVQEYHTAGGAKNPNAVERYLKQQAYYQQRSIKGWQTRRGKAADAATVKAEYARYEEADRQTIAAETNFAAERQQFLELKVSNFYSSYITQLPPEVRDDLMKYFNTDIETLSEIISRIEQNIPEIEAALYRYEIYQGTPQAKEELETCLVKIATILNGGTISEEENIKLTQLAEQYNDSYLWGVYWKDL